MEISQQQWNAAHRIALAILGSPDLASDAAQDALLKVHAKADGDRVAHFDAWFRTVVRNTALNYLRTAWARRRDKEELVVDSHLQVRRIDPQ